MSKQSYTKIKKEQIVEMRTLSPDEKTRGELDHMIRTSNLHGIFVESEHPFPAGAMIEVDVKVPGKDGLYRMLGGVDFSSQNASDHCPAGMGIRLASISNTGGTENAPQEQKPKKVEAAKKEESDEVLISVPTERQVSDIWKGLLNTNIKVKKGAPIDLATEKTIIGVFVCSDDSVGAIIVANKQTVAQLGAALSMIPAEEANAAAAAEEMPQEIAENFREVLNVSTEFFNGGKMQVTLGDMYFDLGSMSEKATALLKGDVHRLDLNIDVEKYGEGKLTVLVRKT